MTPIVNLTGHPWRMLRNQAILVKTVNKRKEVSMYLDFSLLTVPPARAVVHKVTFILVEVYQLINKESWILNIITLDLGMLLLTSHKESSMPLCASWWKCTPPSSRCSSQSLLPESDQAYRSTCQCREHMTPWMQSAECQLGKLWDKQPVFISNKLLVRKKKKMEGKPID